MIHQHVGVTSPRGCTKHIGREHRLATKPPVLDADTVACWRYIAERASLGRLVVTTTSRLLGYLHLRDWLRLSLETGPERWAVTLEGLDCPAAGFRPPATRELNGPVLLVPATAPDVMVQGAGTAQALATRRAPASLHPGRHAVHLPWWGLEWLETLIRDFSDGRGGPQPQGAAAA